MIDFLRALAFIVGFIVSLFIAGVLYDVFRRFINRPKIGSVCNPLILKRDDYISINGRVYLFSHFTRPNEPINTLGPPTNSNLTWRSGDMALQRSTGLGYDLLSIAALSNCDFVYGRYGLKWARTKEVADKAKEEIQAY